MLTTFVNSSWPETYWCATAPHSDSPSSFALPHALGANGNNCCSLCRRSYESSKDTHGAGNGLNSREEYAGNGPVPHLRAGWLAGRSLQGAEYGAEFFRDPGWRRDRPGTGGAGGSSGCRTHRRDEPDLTQARGPVSQPGDRSGTSARNDGGAALLSPSLRIV